MSYYALLSVSDKTGIVDFAEGLVRAGYQIISSGELMLFCKQKAYQ